MGWFSTSIST